jgi:hypothetical protein
MEGVMNKREKNLAEFYRPTVVQQFEHPFDLFGEISLGGHEHFFKQLAEKGLTAYYWVRIEEPNYIYIGYAFYHCRDYTNILPLKPFDEHEHDFEGALLKIPYSLPHQNKKPVEGLICVQHNGLEFSGSNRHTVWLNIEAGSHAIHDYGIYRPLKDNIYLEKYRLVPIDDLDSPFWKAVRLEFNANGVHLPDQWGHNGKWTGLFWNDPAKLFMELEKI